MLNSKNLVLNISSKEDLTAMFVVTYKIWEVFLLPFHKSVRVCDSLMDNEVKQMGQLYFFERVKFLNIGTIFRNFQFVSLVEDDIYQDEAFPCYDISKYVLNSFLHPTIYSFWNIKKLL